MDRVPSNGWTGSRAVSLMPDALSTQEEGEELLLPDRKKACILEEQAQVIPGRGLLLPGLTLDPLTAVATSTSPEWVCHTA